MPSLTRARLRFLLWVTLLGIIWQNGARHSRLVSPTTNHNGMNFDFRAYSLPHRYFNSYTAPSSKCLIVGSDSHSFRL